MNDIDISELLKLRKDLLKLVEQLKDDKITNEICIRIDQTYEIIELIEKRCLLVAPIECDF